MMQKIIMHNMMLCIIIAYLRLYRSPAFQILYACHISTSQPVFLCSFRTICRHLFSPSIICSGRLRHCPAIIVQIVIKIYSKIPPQNVKNLPANRPIHFDSYQINPGLDRSSIYSRRRFNSRQLCCVGP